MVASHKKNTELEELLLPKKNNAGMRDSSSMSKVVIEPLKGTDNYSTWSIIIKEFLNRDDLVGHIDGTIVAPSAKEEEQLENYKKKDRLARSHIVMILSKEAATNVTSILAEDASARRVWLRLKEVYQKENLQEVLNLQSTLYHVRYKNGEEIDRNFQEFESAFVKLS